MRETKERTPHYKKSLGQHILIDEAVVDKILSGIENLPHSRILEIGAGPGTLTKELLKQASTVLAVEIDQDFYYALSPLLKNHPDTLKFFFGDILKFDFKTLVPPVNWLAIGNIPYYLSSPIIEKLILEGRKTFTDFYLMTQKEVGERLAAKPGSRAYGSFSAFVQYYTEPKILFTVRPESFTPPPEVQSCFLRMKVREKAPFPVDEERFFSFIRKLFQQRRKTLFNILRSAFPKFSPELLKKILGSLNIPAESRPEQLGLDKFHQLFNYLKPE